jgi:hypothetical protein
MTVSRSFAAGLLLCTPLPWMYFRLRDGAHTLRSLLVPYVAAGGSTEGSAPAAAALPAQPRTPSVRLVVENRPSDPVSEATPETVKASRIRRAVLAPPCHDCPCCAVYATRQHDAHAEIDRLRAELEAAAARRINTTPRPIPNPGLNPFTQAGA